MTQHTVVLVKCLLQTKRLLMHNKQQPQQQQKQEKEKQK